MPNKTTNYGLTKPLPEEFYDITVQNENMDKIDAELKKKYGSDHKPSAKDVGAVPFHERYDIDASTDESFLTAINDLYSGMEKETMMYCLIQFTAPHPVISGGTWIAKLNNTNSAYKTLEMERYANNGGKGNILYTRSCYNGVWNEFAKVYSEGNKPTFAEIGAAPSSHNHSANDINSGTLPVARGGTGVTSLESSTGLAHALFPISLATAPFIPVIGSGWNGNGYITPNSLRNTMGAVNKAGDTMTGELIVEAPVSAKNTVTGRKTRIVSHDNNSKEADIQNYSDDSNYVSLRLATENHDIKEVAKLTRMLNGSFTSYVLLHNGNSNRSKLVSTETTPTVNNEINWTYE